MAQFPIPLNAIWEGGGARAPYLNVEKDCVFRGTIEKDGRKRPVYRWKGSREKDIEFGSKPIEDNIGWRQPAAKEGYLQ